MKICNLLMQYLYPKTRRKLFGTLLLVLVVLSFIELYYHQNPFHKTFNTNNNVNSELSKIKHRHDGLEKTGFLEEKKSDDVDDAFLSRKKVIKSPESFLPPPPIPSDELSPITLSVLVFADSEKSKRKSYLKQTLSSWKINFDILTWNRPFDNSLVFPRLQDKYGYPRYQTIIFLTHMIFDELDIWTRRNIYNYCRDFKVGILIFADASYKKGVDIEFFKMNSLPVKIKSGEMDLIDFETSVSNVLKFAKSGKKMKGMVNGRHHALFYTNDKTFQPLASCKRINKSMFEDSFLYGENKKDISILFDRGKNDNIKKIIFGSPISTSFLHKLLFLDALSILSNGILGFGLKRHIQIDIDDVFVGQTGKKIIKSDIKALIRAQHDLSKLIPGFKFNLGFSAKFFKRSNNSDERDADAFLVENWKYFRWFCHMYSHRKPHLLSKSEIVEELKTNKEFADEHGIEVDNTYSVSPHHSGIYPVHDALYDAWKEVLDINVTSTEGYPHLYPAWNRKGFLYKDVMVLPRQTCGLFTKTLHNANYPKGPDFLEKSSKGGELFWTIVENPFSIFMTHAGNYGFQERLAIDLFKNVTTFIQEWTNIKLISDTPSNIAKKYFTTFPRQLDPIWGDPCTDPRHKRIWNATLGHCKYPDDFETKSDHITNLPDFLIVGPQKSGTTALHSFLKMHPNIYKSLTSKHAYEEVQFFNRNNYMQGLNWYFKFFPGKKPPGTFFFDKSANYFDSLKTPYRAHALLPHVKIIAILIDPRKRAYSWYQHILSKHDDIALNHTFYEVVTGQNHTSDPRFDMFRKRCLLPGLYALSLERWLQYYKPEKILLVDGNQLRYKPHVTMRRVSEFLNLPDFPFHKRIKYNTEKGFFCSTTESGSVQCLGKSKGRQYNKMDTNSFQYLSDYYRLPNLRFAELLKKIRKPLPGWLKKELEMGETR